MYFFVVHAISSNDFKEGVQNKASKKGSHVSLADFLDRKLHATSVPPRTVQVLCFSLSVWVLRKYKQILGFIYYYSQSFLWVCSMDHKKKTSDFSLYVFNSLTKLKIDMSSLH